MHDVDMNGYVMPGYENTNQQPFFYANYYLFGKFKAF